MFAFEVIGCGISSCYSQLNLRYSTCFKEGASCIQTTTECRFTLTRVCDMIRTHFKNACRSTVLLNYLIHNLVKTSQILHAGTVPVIPSKNWVKTSSLHLITTSSPSLLPHIKTHTHLTDSQYSTWLLKKYSPYSICHIVDIYVDYQNTTYFFFWLIF